MKYRYNVRILTRDEMAEEVDFIDLNDVPEYQGAKLFIVSTNDENPYEGVIYDNGEMWVFGARHDHRVSTLEELLDQIASGDD